MKKRRTMNGKPNGFTAMTREIKEAVSAARDVGLDGPTIRAHIEAITRPYIDVGGATGDFLRDLVAKAISSALAESVAD